MKGNNSIFGDTLSVLIYRDRGIAGIVISQFDEGYDAGIGASAIVYALLFQCISFVFSFLFAANQLSGAYSSSKIPEWVPQGFRHRHKA